MMEQNEGIEIRQSPTIDAPPIASVPPPSAPLAPQDSSLPCPTCGVSPAAPAQRPSPSHVYAIGKIEARFPRLSVEKEFAQAVGREGARGLTDRAVLHATLSKPENRYLARQLCWVMSIGGMDSYLLLPRDPADLSLLVESINPAPSTLDVVIGLRGPIAGPDMCNGLMLPIVVFHQIYSFDRKAFIKAIPKPRNAPAHFEEASEELFDRLMQLTDNAGAADEHRALNYLAVRYPAIYASVAAAFARNASLSSVETRLSALSGARKLVDVIFAYTDRATDVVDRYYARVDVTEEFPFLVTKLSPYLGQI
jgi:hypothetical protein